MRDGKPRTPLDQVPYKTLRVKVADGICTLTLHRPEKRNALDLTMKAELSDAIRRVGDEAVIRVLLITGSGEAFSAGGDLDSIAALEPTSAWTDLKGLHASLVRLRRMEVPVVAAVNGVAVGGACGIALAADIVLASDRARFLFPYPRLGLVPDGGLLYFLPRAVGLARAREILLTGREVTAQEAERLGLVARVVPHQELFAEAQRVSEALARTSALTVRQTKQLLDLSAHSDLETMLTLEGLAQFACFAGPDLREGIRAFRERRPPRFE